MSALNNSLLLGQEGGSSYAISRSLRFNSADSAYLSRTPASAGNRKTWTWAGWVKRSGLGVYQNLFCNLDASNNNGFSLVFEGGDRLQAYDYGSGAQLNALTLAVFRDAGAWYHVVFTFNSTAAIASDRARLYVNGAQQSLDAPTYPTQNADGLCNTAQLHAIGRQGNLASNYLSGYLADIHFIDGQALTPSSFGEFSANTGVWVPKAYTGTYGTNGFKLDFADNSAATATALGKDAAGSNNWTPNNLSLTAGAGNDSLVDVPTNGIEVDTGLGGEVRSNYCTFNPLSKTFAGTVTFSNGNLDVAESSGAYATIPGTIAVSSGRFYWEITRTSTSAASTDCGVGIVLASATGLTNIYGNSNYTYRATGEKSIAGGGFAAYGAAWTTGDVMGVAADLDTGTLTFYRNGISQGTATTSLPTGAAFLPFCGDDVASVQMSWAANFGQRPFAYTTPSGFKALCTANLPAPTIVNPSTVFDTKLYTSNAGTLTVSGLGFSPDFAWLKSRGTGVAHALYDTVRGAGRALKSNTTEAEQFTADGFVSFNSDGFTLGANTSSPQPDINFTNNIARVAWCWDAGTSTVTNTAGSISSQVRANPSAGFSVVTYAGNNTGGATVGHGLGVKPALIIAKSRSVDGWAVRHDSLANNQYLFLNSTAAAATALNLWFNTAPTSAVFTVNSDSNVNGASTNYVAYCFAPVAGLSAFGSYTGNGSADGPFVYTGFRPRWVMIKITNTGGTTDHWVMWDTARDEYNVADSYLLANNPQQEVTSAVVTIDALSNGFKLRNSSSNQNGSGSNYVYAAFAEAPFQYARAR